MTSARSLKSNQSMHSVGSRQSSARKLTNRSNSLLNIYSSNTGRLLTKNPNQTSSRNGGKVSQRAGKKSLNGTFGFVGQNSTSQTRMNRSMLSSSNDRLQTPASKHSRKSSSVVNHHNLSHHVASTLRSKQGSRLMSIDRDSRGHSSSKGENSML